MRGVEYTTNLLIRFTNKKLNIYYMNTKTMSRYSKPKTRLHLNYKMMVTEIEVCNINHPFIIFLSYNNVN